MSNNTINLNLNKLWNEILSLSPPQNVNDLWKNHIIIHEQMNILLKLQKVLKRPDRLANIDKFLDWAKKLEVLWNGIEIVKNSNNNIYLKANKALSIDQIVLEVLPSAVLSTLYVEKNLREILKSNEMLRKMDNIALAIVLAFEILKENKSMWYHYLNILPKKFSTIFYYTLDDFKALKSSPIFEESLRMYRAVARQYVYFYLYIVKNSNKLNNKTEDQSLNGENKKPCFSSIFSIDNFTFDLYRWCVSVVSTRINMLPKSCFGSNEQGMTPALIPFIDLINHGNLNERNGLIFCEEKKINLQICKKIDLNTEILIYYGERTNQNFLLHNGFVPLSENFNNYYELKLGLPKIQNLDFKIKHLFQLKILPEKRISTGKNYVYQFNLKTAPIENLQTIAQNCMEQVVCADKNTSIKNNLLKLWMFGLTFVAKTPQELNKTKNIKSILSKDDLNKKAFVFLVDRFNLLLMSLENLLYNESSNDKEKNNIKINIELLIKSEIEILKNYKEFFASFTKN